MKPSLPISGLPDVKPDQGDCTPFITAVSLATDVYNQIMINIMPSWKQVLVKLVNPSQKPHGTGQRTGTSNLPYWS